MIVACTKRSRDNLASWVNNVMEFHLTNAQLAMRFAEPPFMHPEPGFTTPMYRYHPKQRTAGVSLA